MDELERIPLPFSFEDCRLTTHSIASLPPKDDFVGALEVSGLLESFDCDEKLPVYFLLAASQEDNSPLRFSLEWSITSDDWMSLADPDVIGGLKRFVSAFAMPSNGLTIKLVNSPPSSALLKQRATPITWLLESPKRADALIPLLNVAKRHVDALDLDTALLMPLAVELQCRSTCVATWLMPSELIDVGRIHDVKMAQLGEEEEVLRFTLALNDASKLRVSDLDATVTRHFANGCSTHRPMELLRGHCIRTALLLF